MNGSYNHYVIGSHPYDRVGGQRSNWVTSVNMRYTFPSDGKICTKSIKYPPNFILFDLY